MDEKVCTWLIIQKARLVFLIFLITTLILTSFHHIFHPSPCLFVVSPLFSPPKQDTSWIFKPTNQSRQLSVSEITLRSTRNNLIEPYILRKRIDLARLDRNITFVWHLSEGKSKMGREVEKLVFPIVHYWYRTCMWYHINCSGGYPKNNMYLIKWK